MNDIIDKIYELENEKRNSLLSQAKHLWKEFEDVPIDRDENIDISWHIFEKGTNRQDIWHWFEDSFNVSVKIDLM